MIRLDKITLREIHLPLVDPFRTVHGTVDARRVILLEIRDSTGITAWSECVAESSAGYSYETVDDSWDLFISPLFLEAISKSFGSARDVHDHLEKAAHETPMARAAIEMGCWAIQSIQADTSLARMLARECDAAPKPSVDAGIALGLFPTIDELVTRCRAARDEGYRRIKIKIEPSRDFELADSASRALGGDVPLSVDANASYSLDDLGTLRRLDGLGLAMIEQPLAADDFHAYAELKSQLRTPICLDESIHDDEDARKMIRLQSASIVNLKPGRVGGFTESLAIHNRCHEAGIPLWCGGMLETGIGRAYNVALASLPGFTLPGDLSPSSRYWKRDVITEPWKMEDGALRVPVDRIGIGVEVDEDFINQVTARKQEISLRR